MNWVSLFVFQILKGEIDKYFIDSHRFEVSLLVGKKGPKVDVLYLLSATILINVFPYEVWSAITVGNSGKSMNLARQT